MDASNPGVTVAIFWPRTVKLLRATINVVVSAPSGVNDSVCCFLSLCLFISNKCVWSDYEINKRYSITVWNRI